MYLFIILIRRKAVKRHILLPQKFILAESIYGNKRYPVMPLYAAQPWMPFIANSFQPIFHCFHAIPLLQMIIHINDCPLSRSMVQHTDNLLRYLLGLLRKKLRTIFSISFQPYFTVLRTLSSISRWAFTAQYQKLYTLWLIICAPIRPHIPKPCQSMNAAKATPATAEIKNAQTYGIRFVHEK